MNESGQDELQPGPGHLWTKSVILILDHIQSKKEKEEYNPLFEIFFLMAASILSSPSLFSRIL